MYEMVDGREWWCEKIRSVLKDKKKKKREIVK
jgi:hypothetical protein